MPYIIEVLQPARDFIQELPIKMRAKIFRTISLLEVFGYQLAEPHAKTLQNAEGLKELRVKFASDICRIFYFQFQGKTYIITSGYKKKGRRTDRKHIERALSIMHKYIKENSND